MTFSYDGSKYQGYQKQPNERTIQQQIEESLSKIASNNPVLIHASGRTDAGVHALNQKAHFDLETKVPIERLKYSLNSLLPNDIYIKKLEPVESTFHARFCVTKKEYIYKLNLGEYNPIEKDYVCQWNKPLDIEEMKKALQYLEGTHDFKSFIKSDGSSKDTIRTILKAELKVKQKKLAFTFVGTGFLRYQIRNMVGTIIEIGEGKRKSEEINEILKNKNRMCAGIIAPACGLYLKEVYYD